jgi:hypothetical protein
MFPFGTQNFAFLMGRRTSAGKVWLNHRPYGG